MTDEGRSLGLILLKETHSHEQQITQDIDPTDLETCVATFRKLVENYTAWEGEAGRRASYPQPRLTLRKSVS